MGSKHKDNDFFPNDETKKADILRWQFWESLHFNKAAGAICWETVAKPMLQMGESNQSAIESAIEQFHLYAPVLNAQLEGNNFILGDVLTVADFSVGSHSALVRHNSSQVPLEQYPNILSWYQRLDEIPGWVKSAPAFGAANSYLTLQTAH